MYTTARAAEADFTDKHIYRRCADVALQPHSVRCLLYSGTALVAGTGLVSRWNATPNCCYRVCRVRQGHLRPYRRLSRPITHTLELRLLLLLL